VKRLFAYSSALSVSLASAAIVRADEGLWTFDNFPTARVKAAYGVTIDRAWLNHVMGAEVRLPNGCSASLVSATGLVLTNNHCVSECAQSVSGSGEDAYVHGYVAADLRDERRCPGLTGEVLTSITDVTPQVAGAGSGMTGAALAQARSEVEERLRREACAATPTGTCEIVELFHGAQYKLYHYRKYDEVRLVFSPGATASQFGGDEFPPTRLDAAFLRLYADGKPAITPDHLIWNASAPHAGEPVFVAGNPRVSERQLTVSQLRTERDMALPDELVQAAELIGRLVRFGEESPENRQASQYQVDDLKNHSGYIFDLQQTLNDETFFGRKEAEENDLRSRASPAAPSPWDVVDRAEQARRDQALAYGYVENGPSSELFTYARILVRGALERSKPSAQRLPTFADSQLPLREARLLKAGSVYQPLEQLELEFWLAAAQQFLPTGDPSAALLLDGQTPEALSAQLSRSDLGDIGLRERLWKGGLPAIRASTDPMIRYVLRIDPAARAIRTEWERTVIDPETLATAAIGRARLQAYGADAYPDATRSLRLSFGKIDGSIDRGKSVGPFTTLGDLFARATGHAPYALDPRWTAAKGKLDLRAVLNMSTTNDGINGNSGSPMMDARGEVIGVFYGGNEAAMSGDYGYDPKLNRAAAVSAAAVSEVLTKVYGASRVSAELAASAGGASPS
jgi:hypothetical protein